MSISVFVLRSFITSQPVSAALCVLVESLQMSGVSVRGAVLNGGLEV